MLSIYDNPVCSKVFWRTGKEAQQKFVNIDNIFGFETYKENRKDSLPISYTVNFDSISDKNYVYDYTKTSIDMDGEIGSAKQVKDDCWLLAGIYALWNTSAGRRYIRDSICCTYGNDAYVHFTGVNTTIFIPQISLGAAKQSKNYVDGDDDLLAIEVATEYFKKQLIINGEAVRNINPNIINGKHSSANINEPLGGGFSSDIMYLITGKKAVTFFNKNDSEFKQIVKSIKDMQKNPGRYAMTCNFKEAKDGLYIHHAYAIKNVDEQFVTLINPHNAAKEEKIPIHEFYENVNSITSLKL